MRSLFLLICLAFLGCSKKEQPVYREDKMDITQIKMPDKMLLGNTIYIEVELQNRLGEPGFKYFDISITDENNINIKPITLEPINTAESQYSNEKTNTIFAFSPQKQGAYFLHFIGKGNNVITKLILVE